MAPVQSLSVQPLDESRNLTLGTDRIEHGGIALPPVSGTAGAQESIHPSKVSILLLYFFSGTTPFFFPFSWDMRPGSTREELLDPGREFGPAPIRNYAYRAQSISTQPLGSNLSGEPRFGTIFATYLEIRDPAADVRSQTCGLGSVGNRWRIFYEKRHNARNDPIRLG
jgi:hypothetical protein